MDETGRYDPARTVSSFAEDEYRFGVGVLHMMVDRVDWSTPLVHGGEIWFEVHGVEVSADQRVIGPRRTMVKARRLRSLRRPANGASHRTGEDPGTSSHR